MSRVGWALFVAASYGAAVAAAWLWYPPHSGWLEAAVIASVSSMSTSIWWWKYDFYTRLYSRLLASKKGKK